MTPQNLQAKSLELSSMNSNWWPGPEDIVLLPRRGPAIELNIICQVLALSGASEECGFALRRKRCLQKNHFVKTLVWFERNQNALFLHCVCSRNFCRTARLFFRDLGRKSLWSSTGVINHDSVCQGQHDEQQDTWSWSF